MKALRLHLAGPEKTAACGEVLASSATTFVQFVTCERCMRSVQYRTLKRAHEARIAAGESIGDTELARQRAILKSTQNERRQS